MTRADDRVLRHRLLRRRPRECDLERFVAEQIAVLHGPRRIARDGHDALRHRQPIDRGIETSSGQREQGLPRFGRRGPDLRPAALDRRARDGRALIRRHVRVEADRRDLVHLEIQFLGGNLQERRACALTELGVADVRGRGVVGVDGDPRVDQLRVWRTGGRGSNGRRRALLRERQAGHAEPDDERAAGFEKLTARKRLKDAHRRASAISRDAR